jgi:peptidyl-prolyl cis-trans isomerase SurA
MPIKTAITSFLFLFLSITTTNAQKDRVLFTVNGEKVYSSEFSRIYEKNLSLVNDSSQKDVANYLDLYVNYKLKLKEAYDLKMDTIPSYIREYTKYKNQLIEPYLKDESTKTDLVKEAYNRIQKEVNASHILVKVSKNALPKDTLLAYNKINAARKEIIEGADFEIIAKKISEDPSAKRNGGNLGYFTAFQMVYPFENKAFDTEVGAISEPFRTRFGYHIIKVNDSRASKGEVRVAHIMLKGDATNNKSQIENIKEKLDQGADFSALAKRYSQDGGSSKKGGKLPKFGSGRMVKSFENVAFSLENEGDISEPFKTKFGWHIIKLIKKYPIESFEKMEPILQKKVNQGQRAKIIGNSVVNKLMKEYAINIDQDLYKAFSDKEWQKNPLLKTKTPFFKIESESIPVKKYYQFLISQKSQNSLGTLKRFKEEEVLAYYKKRLPTKFPELGFTLKEYEEGLLLFDLMQKRIWEKAEKDSVGLANFFTNNRNLYQWKDRINAKIVTCSQQKDAIKAKELLKSDLSKKDFEKELASDELVVIKEGLYEKTDSIFPDTFVFNIGISDVFLADNQYVVIKVSEFLDARPKELDETRGKVISDYQDYIEKEWVKELKNRYPVKIKKSSLKKLNKKYQ